VQPVSVFHSFWANLANFGGNQILLPPAIVWALALACLAGAGGLLRFFAGTARAAAEVDGSAVATRRLALLLLLCGALVFLQAPARDLLMGVESAMQGRWLFPMIGPLMVLLCLGWSALPGGGPRALPLIGFAFGSVAVIALVGILMPAFYESFPAVYRQDSLFLLGPYGRPLRAAALAVFVERPGWLRVSWVAGLPVAAFVCAVFAWPIWQVRALRAEEPASVNRGFGRERHSRSPITA
jgi:hypothetical protein